MQALLTQPSIRQALRTEYQRRVKLGDPLLIYGATSIGRYRKN